MDLLSGLALSIVFAVIPMAVFARVITRFDRYEKEPAFLLLAVFLWGFFVAAGLAAVLNTFVDRFLYGITGSQMFSIGATAILVGPLVEESLKGLAVLILYVFFRKYFNTVLDGIIYGGVIGFGFAAAENILYIFGGFEMAGLQGLLSVALARVILIPFLHATLTSFTGLGFALARTSRGKLKYAAPALGYVLAVSMHSLHNLLTVTQIPVLQEASFVIDWTGVIALLFLTYILMRNESGIMKKYLAYEIGCGTINQNQWETAVSPYRKNVTCLKCLDTEKRRKMNEFYKLLGDLAFIKYERDTMGYRGLEDEIARLRDKVKALGKEIS